VSGYQVVMRNTTATELSSDPPRYLLMDTAMMLGATEMAR
jgi:hypothetical protein